MSQLPPPSLRARILDAARNAGPSPTIARRRSTAMLALAGAAVASVGLASGFGPAANRPPRILLAIAIGGGCCAFAAAWVAATRGGMVLGRTRGALAAVAVLAPIALLAVATLATGLTGGVVLAGGTARQHFTCLSLTLLFALGPFLALGYARRGSDPVHPRALGAALGAAAGAWGGAMIDVHCGLTAVEHLALGHVLPILIVSAVGALLGARVLGVRSR